MKGGRPAALHRSVAGMRSGAVAAALAVLAFLAAAVPAACGDTKTLAVTATVLTRSNCTFYTGTSTLNFGAINPAVAADVNATTSIDFVCRGGPQFAVYRVTDDNGQNRSGPGARRMRHATAPEFLPYDLAFSSASGTVRRNRRQTLAISGTVRWADFRGSMAGAYTDSVVVSILP
ncbi:MAG: spore coat protein U domain-containing protein [Candidatus Deferrimicrobium sp.]